MTAVIFFGLLIALVTWLWLFLGSTAGRIEVTRDVITRKHSNGDVGVTLPRRLGSGLRPVPPVKTRGFTEPEQLVVTGSGDAMSLSGFAPQAVIRACEASGWHVSRESTG